MDKRKVANHYHVLTGLPGLTDSVESVTVLPIDRRKLANYMPATNHPCETLAEAGDVALWEAKQFRKAGYRLQPAECSLGKVVGNKHDGYKVLRPHIDVWLGYQYWLTWQTITISPCDEADCRCECCGTLIGEDKWAICPGCGV